MTHLRATASRAIRTAISRLLTNVTAKARPADYSIKEVNIIVRRYNEEMTAERTVLFIENNRVAHKRSQLEWRNSQKKLMGHMNAYNGYEVDEDVF